MQTQGADVKIFRYAQSEKELADSRAYCHSLYNSTRFDPISDVDPIAIAGLGLEMAYVLPQDVVRALLDFKEGKGSPVLALDNMFSNENIPPTPTEKDTQPRWQDHSKIVMEAIMGILGSDVRQPASEDNDDKSSFKQIFPNETDAHHHDRAGSHVQLYQHMDGLRRQNPPDYVGLAILRGGVSGSEPTPNYFTSIHQVIERLPEDVKAELRKPQFRVMGTPRACDRQGNFALLTDNDTNLLFGNVKPINDNAAKAFKTLIETVDSTPVISLALKPGSILLFRNHGKDGVYHGRGAFDPHQEADKRKWSQRLQGNTVPPSNHDVAYYEIASNAAQHAAALR